MNHKGTAGNVIPIGSQGRGAAGASEAGRHTAPVGLRPRGPDTNVKPQKQKLQAVTFRPEGGGAERAMFQDPRSGLFVPPRFVTGGRLLKPKRK